jgi:primosomal protein N' (replication factor Y) (superfamily II helicase)
LSHFIDVILPIPLQKLFTYVVSVEESRVLKTGMRVVVPFGKSKLHTAIVVNLHQRAPESYEAKAVYQILDTAPIITKQQLAHWQWLANYYTCTLGEVLRAALPSAFLLESETLVVKNPSFTDETSLSDDAFLIFEALQHQKELKIKDISAILQRKHVVGKIQQLLKKGVIELKEALYEQYKPKYEKYLKLTDTYKDKKALNGFLENLKNAPKQRHLVLQFFSVNPKGDKALVVSKFLKQSEASAAVLKALVAKGFFDIFYERIDRVQFKGQVKAIAKLSKAQDKAFTAIGSSFKKNDVCLLHGITSSGKTEVYMSLIAQILKAHKQVLFLLPEIALTTQLIYRLQTFFGDKLAVFHSKYSLNERVEVWQQLLQKSPKAQIVIGARSAVLLPFTNLGLIIVDEEQETSYKQFDPAPRYHARDVAIVLAQQHKAKVLLGSATPSLETYYNTHQKKFGLVHLNERFGAVKPPKITLIDLKEQYKKKLIKGIFSNELLNAVSETLALGEQVIIFQNRRGFAPVVTCNACGTTPHCPNCDVSLTYHKLKHNLQCHYCGYCEAMPIQCKACGNPSLDTRGFGTEQIANALQEFYPDIPIGRMDFDTTRGKYAYQKLINDFQEGHTKILVGTQMLAKGLDFSKVTLVGVMLADSMLNYPDFRAHERSFQLLQQVSGRSGRISHGRVLIQTYNPFHTILQQVCNHDYEAMYNVQIQERQQHKYPPFVRLVKIVIKHKDSHKLYRAGMWLTKSFAQVFNENVLGPSDPPISRIRNQYIKTFLIKLPKNRHLTVSKNHILKIRNSFESIAEFRSVRFIIDVDNY